MASSSASLIDGSYLFEESLKTPVSTPVVQQVASIHAASTSSFTSPSVTSHHAYSLFAHALFSPFTHFALHTLTFETRARSQCQSQQDQNQSEKAEEDEAVEEVEEAEETEEADEVENGGNESKGGWSRIFPLQVSPNLSRSTSVHVCAEQVQKEEEFLSEASQEVHAYLD